MKSPIPAATEAYSSCGSAATINCRIPNAVSKRNATPEMNTAPRAACQGIPRPFTTVYVKYAFRPIPGASAIG